MVKITNIIKCYEFGNRNYMLMNSPSRIRKLLVNKYLTYISETS